MEANHAITLRMCFDRSMRAEGGASPQCLRLVLRLLTQERSPTVPTMSNDRERDAISGAKIFRAFAVLGITAIIFWIIGPVAEVLLLGFAGLLLALFLRGVASWVAKRTPLSERLALAGFCLLLVGLAVVIGFVASPEIGRQAEELTQTLPKAVNSLNEKMDDTSWGRALVGKAKDALDRRDTVTKAGGLLSSTLGAFASLIVLLFLGLFVAFEMPLYKKGALRLVSVARRERIASVLHETATTLQRWMVGKLVAMVVVGVSTSVGLFFLDIPLAITLGLIAALLTFIPNFGPVLSAIPPILLALMQSPIKAIYVIALYVGVQTIESYVLTPLLQKKTVSLPPAVTIIAQVVMGTLTGGIGVVVATPLTVAAVIVIRALYVEDVLERSAD